MMTDRELGFFLGIVTGEGSFGGDGRQPQLTIRMHTRHERLFHWLVDTVPGGRLYGPYHHGGRSYYQWMVRGAALREHVVPLLRTHEDLLDTYVLERLDAMCRDYGITAEPPSS